MTTRLNRHFPHITLASQSPRRADLLRQIGLRFAVCPSDVEEPDIANEHPEPAVQRIALAKAKTVADTGKLGLFIGADTTVVIDEQALGKPDNDAHAVEMLTQLCGNSHEVVTGVALIDLDRRCEATWSVRTTVFFRKLYASEIVDYVRSGEALDKAGAYGIQGRAAAFVERIEGCYFNVVGLPLASLVGRLWLLASQERRQ